MAAVTDRAGGGAVPGRPEQPAGQGGGVRSPGALGRDFSVGAAFSGSTSATGRAAPPAPAARTPAAALGRLVGVYRSSEALVPPRLVAGRRPGAGRHRGVLSAALPSASAGSGLRGPASPSSGSDIEIFPSKGARSAACPAHVATRARMSSPAEPCGLQPRAVALHNQINLRAYAFSKPPTGRAPGQDRPAWREPRRPARTARRSSAPRLATAAKLLQKRDHSRLTCLLRAHRRPPARVAWPSLTRSSPQSSVATDARQPRGYT